MKVVIPARYDSSRLPGKPLADIAGKPMIQHVWERGVEATGNAADVVVATDDKRVFDAACRFGAHVAMTAETHESGTDRIAEVANQLGWDDDAVVVNLQGDEPLMPSALVRAVGEALEAVPDAHIATASCPIVRTEDVKNPNIVKVVTANGGAALYFSRAPIPHNRDDELDASKFPYQRHIGLYAYRVATLAELTKLPVAPLEALEQLEQLRALAAGMKVQVVPVEEAPPHGVDCESDLEAVRTHFKVARYGR